jgi:hypothetical protein
MRDDGDMLLARVGLILRRQRFTDVRGGAEEQRAVDANEPKNRS